MLEKCISTKRPVDWIQCDTAFAFSTKRERIYTYIYVCVCIKINATETARVYSSQRLVVQVGNVLMCYAFHFQSFNLGLQCIDYRLPVFILLLSSRLWLVCMGEVVPLTTWCNY